MSLEGSKSQMTVDYPIRIGCIRAGPLGWDYKPPREVLACKIPGLAGKLKALVDVQGQALY